MRLRRRSFRRVTAVVALTFAGAALAGCSTKTPPDGSAEQTPSFSSDEEYQLAFAECMRSKGIDMSDSQDRGHVAAGTGDAFLEAAESCQAELGTAPAGSNDGRPSDAEQREIFLQMAQCFRDNGLDVTDPAPGESLSVPLDAPQELFEKCATAGEGDTTGGAP